MAKLQITVGRANWSESRLSAAGHNKYIEDIAYLVPRPSILDQLKARLHEPVLKMWTEWDEHEPRALYHFTNIANMKKIVKSKTLWLSDVPKKNDPTEFLYAARVVNYVLKNRWAELPVNISDAFNLRGRVGLGSDWRVYVASFCPRHDRLGLWWRYAEQGSGVAMEFEYAAVKGYVNVIPMQYNRLQLIDATEFLCDLGLSLSDEADFSFGETIEFWVEVCKRILTSSLRFKHPLFSEEGEFRALKICDVSDPCCTRVQDSELVHYVESRIVETGLKRIVIGPMVNMGARRELRQFLDESGLNAVEIVHASLPLR